MGQKSGLSPIISPFRIRPAKKFELNIIKTVCGVAFRAFHCFLREISTMEELKGMFIEKWSKMARSFLRNRFLAFSGAA